jgi:hypothetical protein
MTAHRVETTVTEDGTLALKNLPIRAGERVEIIILMGGGPPPSSAQSESDANRFPLRGLQPYRYDDPFGPAVPEEDWDALK